jgi:hypothetical protein
MEILGKIVIDQLATITHMEFRDHVEIGREISMTHDVLDEIDERFSVELLHLRELVKIIETRIWKEIRVNYEAVSEEEEEEAEYYHSVFGEEYDGHMRTFFGEESLVPTVQAPIPTVQAPIPTVQARYPTAQARYPTVQARYPTVQAPILEDDMTDEDRIALKHFRMILVPLYKKVMYVNSLRYRTKQEKLKDQIIAVSGLTDQFEKPEVYKFLTTCAPLRKRTLTGSSFIQTFIRKTRELSADIECRYKDARRESLRVDPELRRIKSRVVESLRDLHKKAVALYKENPVEQETIEQVMFGFNE